MASAHLVGKPVVGNIGEVHTTRQNPIGMECDGLDANGKPFKAIYLAGASSVGDGSSVTYDEDGAVTLLAANAKGPVAIATAAVDSTSKYGWYIKTTFGGYTLDAAASSADNATLGRETSDGQVGDGRAAGDQIIGAFSRGASASGAQLVQIVDGPIVDDFQGA